ncbi:hypothetical protein HED50_22490 [Ochrobactrum oryzae]|nr:hypothetical protein [Brucella oryzae]
MHGRLDYHKSKALNALLTTEVNERSKSAQDRRFDDWFGELFSYDSHYGVHVLCCDVHGHRPHHLNPRRSSRTAGDMQTSPVTLSVMFTRGGSYQARSQI